MFKNEKLKKVYEEELATARASFEKRCKTAKELAEKYAPMIERLQGVSELWFYCNLRLYLHANGSTKADFSEAVKRVAEILGEAPDVDVKNTAFAGGEYVADFPQNCVQVYLSSPSDCKLIEETTTETITKTVLKPHPSCLGALKELEEAG